MMRYKHMAAGVLLGGLLLLSACAKAMLPVAGEDARMIVEPETDMAIEPFPEAEDLFRIARELSDRDGGRLWGQELYAPLLIVDGDTRYITADTPDREGYLTENSGFYVGIYPDDRGIANTAVEFGGEHYAMVVRQMIPEDQKEAGQLMIHEMFHRHQEALGLAGPAGSSYDNSHLEEMEARISLQLEWAALEQALRSEGEARQQAVSHALAFREERRVMYNRAADENQFEIHEGMAEYTGYRAAYEEEAAIAELIAGGEYFRYHSFVRNYAYYSGPLYGYLLDAVSDDWRDAVSHDTDLGTLLSTAYQTAPFGTTETVGDLYGYQKIYAGELALKEERDVKTAQYLQSYTEQPVLWLPTNEKRYSFVPALVQRIAGLGTVYACAELYDDWGALDAGESSFVFTEDDAYALVSAGELELTASGAKGDGWELKLESGFEIQKKENGDYAVLPVSAGT